MRALIVGASRGIGLELVRRYRAAGAAVAATARDDAGLARLRALGATPLRLDVTDAASVAAFSPPPGLPPFDRVVCNAGVFGPRTTGLEPPVAADFDAVMHANVRGAMWVLPVVAGWLAPDARLAVVSSEMGSIGGRTGTHGWLYRASKAALNSVLKDVSMQLAASGAVCVALHPGWVRTDMGGPSAPLQPADSAEAIRRLLDGLAPQHNGGFFRYDGTPLAW